MALEVSGLLGDGRPFPGEEEEVSRSPVILNRDDRKSLRNISMTLGHHGNRCSREFMNVSARSCIALSDMGTRAGCRSILLSFLIIPLPRSSQPAAGAAAEEVAAAGARRQRHGAVRHADHGQDAVRDRGLPLPARPGDQQLGWVERAAMPQGESLWDVLDS